MSKSNEYWKRRMELLEESQINKGEQYLKDLDDQYTKATKNIERELSVWYRRFAANNEISMTEARKLLTTRELKEFHWDVNEYIKYGKENALDQRWMKELENASARVHVSRLQALKVQLQQQVEVLYGNQMDGIDDLLRDIYTDGYYHTAWEVQKGFNIGWDLHALNDNQLDKVLSKPWTMDGKTFSNRLWTNKQLLIGNLQTHLTQSVITGKAPDEVIKRLSAQFKTDRNKAGRLVMTESAAFASMAQKDAFTELDVERFEIVATLDNNTSEICQELDGEVFDMKDFEVGATAPPFHPWCRTTTVPYFDDGFSLGERAARDEKGETYYVPSDIKYPDWKESFVDGGSKVGLNMVDPQYMKDFNNIVGRNPNEDELNYTQEDLTNYLLMGEFPKQKVKVDFKTMNNTELSDYVKSNLKTDIGDLTCVNNQFAQEVIRVLDEFEERINGTVNGLKVQFGGTSSTEAGAYDPVTKILKLKKTGSMKAFEDRLIEENERALKKLGRVQHIETDYAGTIWHELGHVIDSDVSYRMSEVIAKDPELFKAAIKISNYAGSGGSGLNANKATETLAENFAAYMNGTGNKHLVDDRVVELIETYFRNKRIKVNMDKVDF